MQMVIQRCFGNIGSQVRILLPRQKMVKIKLLQNFLSRKNFFNYRLLKYSVVAQLDSALERNSFQITKRQVKHTSR